MPLAPLPGAVNVTITPLTGLLTESTTVAWRRCKRGVDRRALAVPAVTCTVAGGPVLVSAKFAGVATPETDDVTVVGAARCAIGREDRRGCNAGGIRRGRVVPPSAKVPLAPLPGAVNVTVTPLTGLFPESFTVACNWVANAVLMLALWRCASRSRDAGGGSRKIRQREVCSSSNAGDRRRHCVGTSRGAVRRKHRRGCNAGGVRGGRA